MDEELNGQIVPEKCFLRFYFKLSKCLKYLNQLKPKCVLLSKKEEEEERNSIKGFSSGSVSGCTGCNSGVRRRMKSLNDATTFSITGREQNIEKKN